ncbi:MAG TPA: peptidoglycan editing factor PgeF [Peptococcaceae bacterium]|nr:peptidoglycan editing factor PgeF [Peptococcaceae bacterium]HQD54719.1 peptidoglycan editing factor PgeF [Peptococcaceae bacterium]
MKEALNKSFSYHEQNGIEYYTVPAFTASGLVIHAFSGRNGGYSEGGYGTLNLGLLTDDDPELVVRNRKKFCEVVGIDPNSIVGTEQVHGDRVLKVTQAEKGHGALDKDSVIPGVDALMTNERGVSLTAYYADCVPVLFLDPVLKVIGVAHAGWKGTFAKIAAKTVQAMAAEYGCRPELLLVGIGPSIGPCHYEVDEPVLEIVKEAFPAWWKTLLEKSNATGATHLDLWEANRKQLCDVGVKEENITVCRMCTYCLPEKFFSYRAGMPGRQMVVITLK